jgi:hypothetical protein
VGADVTLDLHVPTYQLLEDGEVGVSESLECWIAQPPAPIASAANVKRADITRYISITNSSARARFCRCAAAEARNSLENRF